MPSLSSAPKLASGCGVKLLAFLLSAAALSGCAGFSRAIDRWALRMKATTAVEQGVAARKAPLPFRDAAELEALTRPAEPPEVTVGAETRYRLDDDTLVQEELSFASAVTLRFPESNRAAAHVYRRGPLGQRPVLLWVPGQAIQASDMASLAEYFGRAIDRGYDVVLFVPPYHLERSPAGFASGDAFLATDFSDHLGVFAQELSDVRRLIVWIRSQGARTLGAFGSSMGGGALLRIATWDGNLDFLVLKQPLVDWNSVMKRPEMAGVRERIAAQGYRKSEVEQAYRALDSRRSRPRLSPSRIALLYGQFDEIADPRRTRELARRWGITRVKTYRRGHSLITFGGATYRDVGLLLEEERRAADETDPSFAARWPAPRRQTLLVE